MPVKHESFLELSGFVRHDIILYMICELEGNDNQQRYGKTGSEERKPPQGVSTFAKQRQGEGRCRRNDEKKAFILGKAGTACKESGGGQYAQRRRIGTSLKIKRDQGERRQEKESKRNIRVL